MDNETPLQRDVMVYILREQRHSVQGTAQVSTQLLAEKLEVKHGHLSVMQVRTTLSDLIEKGLVHFQQQMGGFQIVQCSLTDKGVTALHEQGIDMDALEDEPEPASSAHVAGLLGGVTRLASQVPDTAVGQRLIDMAQVVETGDMTEEVREELIGALELLAEQATAPSDSRRRGRLRLALRSLQELGTEEIGEGLVDIEPWIEQMLSTSFDGAEVP